jgi:hypothetical protein
MGYFDTDEGVDEYIGITEGHDGRELIETLRSYVPSGSGVLEIGMGPGKDLTRLQHLTRQDARRALVAQHRVLNSGGIALHSLWYGDECEEHEGLPFQRDTPESFAKVAGERVEVLESKSHREMTYGDSLCVVPRCLDSLTR